MRGLAALHERDVVYRDVKPSNIFIRKKGEPLLLDFGSARQLKPDQSLTIVVTPGYSPIEQFKSNGKQGPWTDVFALGGVLYRIVSGHRPVRAMDRMLAKVSSHPDPLVPATIVGREDYSVGFLQAIDHALAIDESDRPQDGPIPPVFGKIRLDLSQRLKLINDDLVNML